MPFSEYNLMNNKEAILQRMKGVQAERKAFGYSVLAGESKDTYTKAPAETNNVQNKNSADDGKISFKEKIVNFGKGLIAPIKSIFASPKNMAITAVTVAASAALIAVTGGAAAPVMVAAGLIGGGIQIGKGIYKQAKATTDDQAKQAWQQMGTGTFAVGASVAGAKSALKANGVNVEGMSALKASAKCVTSAPKNIANSFSSIGTKVSGWFPALKKKTVKAEVKPETKAEVKSETKPEVKPETKAEVKPETKTVAESEVQPAVQSKAKTETTSVVESETTPVVKQKVNPEVKAEVKPTVKSKGRVKTSASNKKQIITPDGKIITIDDTMATPFWRTSPRTAKPVGVETTTTVNSEINPSLVSRFKNFMNIYGLFKQ